ncbi:MAG: hypothetical protein ACW97V_11790, partial [Promethearchaeota archaeon]
MSSKSKIIIGIVMLAVGAGLVPTGLVTNEYLIDQVYDGVPDALLGVKDEAIPALMEEIPVLAVPDVLAGAKAQAAAGLEPMLTVRSTPSALLGMKAQIEAEIPGIVNFATLAQGMAFAFDLLNASVGTAAALDTFFNNATYIDPFISLPSIAMIVGNLSYTLFAAQTLLFDGFYDGDFVGTWGLPSNTVPAILEDLDLGLGASGFYTFMGNAWYWKYVIGPYTYPMDSAMANYNATEAQLLSIPASGYMDWAIANWVPGAFLANYGFNTTVAATTGFYRQWANGTFTDDGIDLGYFLGTSELKGVEAGVPDPTNISLSTSMALWDASNPLAFTNDSGILTWVGAMTNASLQTLLATTFSLTPTQLTMILSWLNNFITNITPVLVLADTGKTINELATLALYEQWANGTIFGEVVLPGGFLGEIDSGMAGAPFFEVGLPSATGLSLTECLALWSTVIPSKSFTYAPAFESLWLTAMLGNTTSQAALIAEFSISPAELTAILTWLGAFIGTTPSVGRSSELLELDMGLTIAQISTRAFYEQWANGTILGTEALPDGFLSRRVPPIYGAPYFEIGLEYHTELSLSQCVDLWDQNSDYSLV